MSSSAEDGGVKEFENASTSSMNFTTGIPRSFSPSVMESKLISSTVVVSLASEAAFEASSVDMVVVVEDGMIGDTVSFSRFRFDRLLVLHQINRTAADISSYIGLFFVFSRSANRPCIALCSRPRDSRQKFFDAQTSF